MLRKNQISSLCLALTLAFFLSACGKKDEPVVPAISSAPVEESAPQEEPALAKTPESQATAPVQIPLPQKKPGKKPDAKPAPSSPPPVATEKPKSPEKPVAVKPEVKPEPKPAPIAAVPAPPAAGPGTAKPLDKPAAEKQPPVAQAPAATEKPNFDALDKGVAWGVVSGRRRWSATVRAIVRERFADFDLARDKEEFCPGYAEATQRQKENCFVAIIAGMSKFEGDFRPHLAFDEGGGHYSVGLMMLSEGECRNAPEIDDLKDPIENLKCGTNKMADLIRRDHYISGPPQKQLCARLGFRDPYCRSGASAYWSTYRTPYIHPVRKWKLGKKFKILPHVRHFRGRD
jgi:hypothetical protein